MFKRFLHTLILASLGSNLWLSGCAQFTSTARYAVVIPDELEIDGIVWSKQDWDSKLDSLLQNYFKRNPHVAENPGFQCQPVVYENGAAQRIYWVSPVGDTCQWLRLDFNGNRASEIVEGAGEPFLKLERLE